MNIYNECKHDSSFKQLLWKYLYKVKGKPPHGIGKMAEAEMTGKSR